MITKYDSFINEASLSSFTINYPELTKHILAKNGDVFISYLHDIVTIIMWHGDVNILQSFLDTLFLNRIVTFDYEINEGEDGEEIWENYTERKAIITKITIVKKDHWTDADIYFKTKDYDDDQIGCVVNDDRLIIVHDYTNSPARPAPIPPRRRIRWYQGGKLAED